METNVLNCLFFDNHGHWNQIQKNFGKECCPFVIKGNEKSKGCGNIVNGFELFVYKDCPDVKKRHIAVKIGSVRPFLSEGEEWSRILVNDMIRLNRHHILFMIDEGLRNVFLLHRYPLKLMMDKAARLAKDFFWKNET